MPSGSPDQWRGCRGRLILLLPPGSGSDSVVLSPAPRRCRSLRLLLAAAPYLYTANWCAAALILVRFWRAAYLAHQFHDGIVKFIHHALFERNDGIVGNVYLFRADLSAAFGDVAIADAELVLQKFDARDIVQRM